MSKKKKETLQSNSTLYKKMDTVPTEAIAYPVSDNFLKNHWWKVIAICVLGLSIYFKTAHYGYVLDDVIVLSENKFVKKGFSGIGEILTTETMTGYFEEQKNLVQGNRYRPLSLVSFAMENGVVMASNPDSNIVKTELINGTIKELPGQIKVSKLKPGVSHVVNIFLYILSCVIIMRTLQLLLKDKNKKIFGVIDYAFITAILYLVHPLHVEAVANIKGRDEIMAMLLAMTSLYCFVQYYLYGKSAFTFYGALVAFFMALLSKENAITFVAIIPLSILFFGEDRKGKAWNAFAWTLLVSIIYLMLRFQAAGVPKLNEKITDIMNNPFLDMSGMEKIATIIYTLGVYIKLMIFPYPLTHDYYPYAIPIMHFTDWKVWLSVIVYATLIYVAFKSYKEKSMGSYAILFYLITLTIVSNVVINLGTFMNDRFIYMPSLGYCMLLSWLIYEFSDKINVLKAPTVKAALMAVPILCYAVLSIIRVPDWANAMTLNRSALKISNNSARANSFMSTALFEEYKLTQDGQKKRKLLTEALPYAKKAIEIIPDYYNANLMAVGIAGELHKLDGDLDKLITVFEPCIVNRPNIQFTIDYLKYINPMVTDKTKMLDFYNRIGTKLMQKGNTDSIKWAIQYMQMGLQIDPNNIGLNKQLNQAFTSLGDLQQAQQYIR